MDDYDVWVAGNVANMNPQVITAAGEGSAAAIELNADLVDDDVARAARGQSAASAKRAARTHGRSRGLRRTTPRSCRQPEVVQHRAGEQQLGVDL